MRVQTSDHMNDSGGFICGTYMHIHPLRKAAQSRACMVYTPKLMGIFVSDKYGNNM